MANNPPPPLPELLSSYWRLARDRQIAAGQQPLTIKEMAEAIGASRAAVYLWLNGQRQPKAAALEKMAEVFAAKESERREIYSRLLDSLEQQERKAAEAEAARQRAISRTLPRPAVLISSDIAAREKYARDLWIFKWNKPFLSADDKFLFSQIRQFIDDHDTAARIPRFHYVFPSKTVMKEMEDLKIGERVADYSARVSFRKLRDTLSATFGEGNSKYEGIILCHELKHLSDVLYLGIPRAEFGYFMIEYTAEGVELFGRSVDVFVEVDARVQTPPDVDPVDAEVERRETYWIELPRETAARMWETWHPVLDGLETVELSRLAA